MATRPPGYESRLAQRTAPVGGASGEAFGAGVGRAIAGAAGAIEDLGYRRQSIERNRDRQDQTAAFSKSFADVRIEMDRLADKWQVDAPADGSGVVQKTEEIWAQRQQQLLDAIADPKVRAAAQQQLDSYRVGLIGRADTFEHKRRLEKMGGDTASYSNAARNRVAANPTAEALGEELDALDGFIASLPAGEGIKQQLAREEIGKLKYSYGTGLETRNPGELIKLLDSAEFTEHMTPEQVERLRNGAGVEIRRQQADAQRQVNAARVEARERINVFQKQLSDGVPVPDDDIAAMQTLAAKVDLPGEVYDLGRARIVNNENRIAQGMTPAQIDARIKEFDTRIAQAGDKASPADVIAATHLRSILPKRTAEIREDPLSWGARNGMAIAPIDFGDPASIAGRIAQARSISAQTGAPLRVLTDEEAQQLAGQMQSGTAQSRLGVADQLAKFGPGVRGMAARQVAPGDQLLQRSLSYPPQLRARIFSGADLRKANSALVPKQDSDTEWARLVGRSMYRFPSADRVGTMEVARNVYASMASQQGETEFDAELFGRAVHLALGGTWGTDGVTRGGVGEWNDGKILIPTTMTAKEVTDKLSWIDAFPGAVARDGSPADPKTIKRTHWPVMIADGIYNFETASGSVLMDASGRPYVWDARRPLVRRQR